jgi:hypothetical protein
VAESTRGDAERRDEESVSGRTVGGNEPGLQPLQWVEGGKGHGRMRPWWDERVSSGVNKGRGKESALTWKVQKCSVFWVQPLLFEK